MRAHISAWVAFLIIMGATESARSQEIGPYTVTVYVDFMDPLETCLESGDRIPQAWYFALWVQMEGFPSLPSVPPGFPPLRPENLTGSLARNEADANGDCVLTFEDVSGRGDIDPFLVTFRMSMITDQTFTIFDINGVGPVPAVPSTTECYGEDKAGPTILLMQKEDPLLARPIPGFPWELTVCPDA
jgi:hypothetical protein